MSIFKVILFITVIIAIGLSELTDKNWDAIFGEELISSFKAQWKNGDTEYTHKHAILSKAGKIAFYMRLYRAWIFTPAGKKGFADKFPEPRITVRPEIVQHCDKDLYKCIDAIYTSIQKHSEFLFPSGGQDIEDFNIDEENFRRYVSDSMFAYDVSVSYLMCFFTKNQLQLLSNLPFCSYGFEKGQKDVWPSMMFRDLAYNSLIINNTYYESIDFLDDEDFVCADESFCPDPCCGRTTNRTTFCSHEICREQDIRRTTLLQHQQTQQQNQSSSNSTLSADPQPQHSCRVDNDKNNNFVGLALNKWNVSCTCNESDVSYTVKESNGLVFRFDTLQCVDFDECDSIKCEGENEECINHIGSYSCVCQQGFYRDSKTNKCVEIVLRKSNTWFGAAHAPALSDSVFYSVNCNCLFLLLLLLLLFN